MKDSARQELRRKCQTDIWFLGKEILQKDFHEQPHREFADFFVKKNPDKTIFEQDKVKNRMMLMPRGSYKSTWDCIDVVQWIICFPHIKIMVLTGEDSLAIAFVNEIQDYFVVGSEGPTLFQELFPEFCIDGKSRKLDGTFITPARKAFAKEPTVFASSLSANKAGWHVHLLICDDVLTETNTGNPEQVVGSDAKLTKKFHMARKLLKNPEPGCPTGYHQIIGTPYIVGDTYQNFREAHGITRVYGLENKRNFKYLCKPAWWLKGTDFAQPDYNLPVREEAMDLLFPGGLPFEEIDQERANNFSTFCSQALCNPAVDSSMVSFTRDELVAATLQIGQLPKNLKIFIAWDLAYSARKGRDYTVGAVGAIDDQGRMFLRDIIRGKFNPGELPYIVAKAIQDYRPVQTLIEDIRGAQWLKPAIERYAKELGVDANIWWKEADNQYMAKSIRIQELKEILVAKRLYFMASIPDIDTLYKEFTNFHPLKNTGNDDIPDAIALLRYFSPRVAIVKDREEWEKKMLEIQNRDFHDRMYRRGIYSNPEPALMPAGRELSLDPYTGLPS